MTEQGHRLELRAGAATDVGRARTINQDGHLLRPERGLWAVADGMGGAQGGEVASAMALEVLEEAYNERGIAPLLAAIAEANHRIHQAADDPDLRGMGTTTVALAVVPAEGDVDEGTGDQDSGPQHLVVVNVGDSRAYLFRDGALTQLTEDHSIVGELVRDGRITREEANVHPQRNIVTRVLGPYEEIEADLWPIDAVRGDRILLCSDGLFGEVSDDQISAVLRRLGDPNEAATELVRLANDAGGRDNITVVVVDVVDDGGIAESASAALAGRTSGLAAGDRDGADLAGFSTAISPEGQEDEGPAEVTPKPSRAERKAARRARRVGRTRLTWRVVAFVILLVAVIGGALATVQWYGTSTYFVAYDGDEVAIFQGRPGGLLWIDPTLEEDTGILRDEVPAAYRAALEEGHELSSRAQAERYVSNIERDIAEATTTTTTTTTTAAPPVTPTTAAPAN